MNALKTSAALSLIVGFAATGSAAITGFVETNPDTDLAVIGVNLQEDSLFFSDRVHQHNGPGFDATTGLLSTGGTNIKGIPSYLLGNDYMRLANDARSRAGYSIAVTVDIDTQFYLLLDNRNNGVAGDTSSTPQTDPVLGGNLQWVIDKGWVRVNTGISPNGQPDFTGIDEDPVGVGPGVSIQQFFSIYTKTVPAGTEVFEAQNSGGGNMYSIVARPVPEPTAFALVAAAGLVCGLRRRRS